MARKPYPTGVIGKEWAFMALHLALMHEDVPLRDHSLQELYNGLGWMIRTASPGG